jgi:hypothetical protein
MVIIYSATTSTMQNYVHNALKDEGVHISWRSRQLLANIIIDIAFKALSKEMGLMKYMQRLIGKGNMISWRLRPWSDFKPGDTYNKLTNVPIQLKFRGHRMKTSFNVVSNLADTRAMKQSVFVNIIHSLDALHLQIFLETVQDKNLLTIHDAILHPWTANKADIVNSIATTFMKIHREHTVFKNIVDSIAERLGHDAVYQSLLNKLQLIRPRLEKVGALIA